MKFKFFFAFLFVVLIFDNCALCFRMTPQLEKEIKEKEAVVLRNPTSPDAHFDLAIIYAYSNKIENGLNELKKTASLAGDSKAYEKKIIEKYYALVLINPSDWKTRFRLAFAYYFGGYKSYALLELKNISNLDTRNPWPHGYAALIYAEEGKWDKAIEKMKAAIAIDSKVAAFHLGLGEAYYKTNNSFAGFFEIAEALRLRSLGY